MILYYDDDYIGSLYYSRYEDGLWTPAVKMGEYISTKYWESHASFSKDGQSLYFTSNRKGTHGGLDIYVSGRNSDGSWGPAVNLGPTINSPYNEESPYISEDGNTLYFSSYGHYNMGGYDIFYSKRGPDGSWSEPVNIGYPINTTDNDLYFQPIQGGDAAYYSLYNPRGVGRHDIYLMDIYSINNPRYYAVTGNLRTGDGVLDSTQIAIYVVDTEKGDTLIHTPPGQDGSFGFELKQGIYALHITGAGYDDLIRPLRITPDSNKDGIRLSDDLTLNPAVEEETMLVFEGEESQIQLREDSYEGVAGESLEIPIRAPRGSTIFVDVYQDSVLVSSDTIEMDRRRANLEIVPLPGQSEVQMTMRDEDGNLHRNSFTVSGALPALADVEEEMPEEEQGTSLKDPLPEAAAALLLIEQADQVSGGDLEKLKQEISDHSEGALKEYIDLMDSEKEGISNVEEFMNHLGEVALSEGFTMDDVSQAMIDSLEADAEAEDLVSLVGQLHQEAEGNLKTTLQQLSVEQEGISNAKQLFEHLYEQAETREYHKNEVDAMLSDVLAHGDAELLRQHLIENSQGALKEYLLLLDLEKEGITKADELLRHLEEVAEAEGFDMETVRRAMLEALQQPLEVDRIYEELLEGSDTELNALLKELDLRKEGIYTTEELIEVLYQKLAENGYDKKEIEEILRGLFPDHTELIQDLGEEFGGKESGNLGLSWPLLLLFIAVGAGLIWFFILWWRRRDKNNEEEK
jgi:surface antigen/lipoate-protein ligase A